MLSSYKLWFMNWKSRNKSRNLILYNEILSTEAAVLCRHTRNWREIERKPLTSGRTWAWRNQTNSHVPLKITFINQSLDFFGEFLSYLCLTRHQLRWRKVKNIFANLFKSSFLLFLFLFFLKVKLIDILFLKNWFIHQGKWTKSFLKSKILP